MKSSRGFTLIELLVTITIIVILALIIIASISQSRMRSKATRVVQDFQQMERAMLLLADDEKIIDWWIESDFGLGADPTIEQLISSTPLSKFLSRAPKPTVGDAYFFDSDDDIFACGFGVPENGVNIALSNVPLAYLDIIDNIIDRQEDSDCGRVTYDGSTLYYKLAADRDNY